MPIWITKQSGQFIQNEFQMNCILHTDSVNRLFCTFEHLPFVHCAWDDRSKSVLRIIKNKRKTSLCVLVWRLRVLITIIIFTPHFIIQALASLFRPHNLWSVLFFFCFVQNSSWNCYLVLKQWLFSQYKAELFIRILLASFPSQINLYTFSTFCACIGIMGTYD